MLTKTLAVLAFGTGGLLGGAMMGAQGGLMIGAIAAAVVLVFRKLVRRMLMIALILGSLAVWLGYLPPAG
jgi:hypothetical protein